MSEAKLSVLDGNTFVVSDQRGDVRADEGREHGFFAADTRFISRWVLGVDDTPLQLLGRDQGTHFAAQFFLTPIVGPEDEAPRSIMRRRLIDHVWIEDVTVINHLALDSQMRVTLEVGSDFADLFEVKDGHVAKRHVTRRHDDRSLTLSYERDGFRRAVAIDASRAGQVSCHGFAYEPLLAPGEQWTTTFTLTPSAEQTGTTFTRRRRRGGIDELRRSKSDELDAWLERAPSLTAQNPALLRTYRASLTDLGALRMHPDLTQGATLPAAGLPWFMALFGRDSLITSFQALPYLPELAETTLRRLASDQADVRDDFQEREPGKILHELRFGELTARGERPHSPYYGTADATPLSWSCLTRWRAGRSRCVKFRDTCMTRGVAALAWRARSGATPTCPSASSARRPSCASSSGTTSGSRSAAATPWRWTATSRWSTV